MDHLSAALEAMRLHYGDKDPVAKAELTRRIAATGKRLQLITYSDLVKGVPFRLPNVNSGEPYYLGADEWSGLDRAILGEFLAVISAETYAEGGFLATALVVNKAEYKPSDQFFKWMKELGILPDTKEDTVLAFWADHVNRARNWDARH